MNYRYIVTPTGLPPKKDDAIMPRIWSWTAKEGIAKPKALFHVFIKDGLFVRLAFGTSFIVSDYDKVVGIEYEAEFASEGQAIAFYLAFGDGITEWRMES